MHFELVKALIRIAGSSPAAIASELQISSMTVSHVIRGVGKSARVAKRICEITGKGASELWPGRYPELEQEQEKKRSSARRSRVPASN